MVESSKLRVYSTENQARFACPFNDVKGAYKSKLAVRKAVQESQDILHRAFGNVKKSDSVNDFRNFAAARNHDHSLKYAQSVSKRLKEAVTRSQKNGTSLEDEVVEVLGEIRDVLQKGNKYRY